MDKLGVNTTLLGFQIINFIIIVYLLNQLIFKPLAKIIAERKKKIEIGLAKEDEAELQIAGIQIEKEKQLALAKIEIDKLLAEATQKANAIKNELLAGAKIEADDLVSKAKERISTEKNELMVEAKSQIGELVVQAIENIFSQDEAQEIKKMFNQKAIDQLWQTKKK